MRIILILTICISSINLFGQVDSSKQSTDCESLTEKYINQLPSIFGKNQFDKVDSILIEWNQSCDTSECSQRLTILKNILEKKESLNSIKKYFESELHMVFYDRVMDSRSRSYKDLYSDKKSYYGYVPLNHTTDSLTIAISRNLLKSDNLTPDEKLICILFTGDTDWFEIEAEKDEYDESFTKPFWIKFVRDNRLAFIFYAGNFRPFSSNDVFTNSPMFGFSFSTPVKSKIIMEICLKFRLNMNDSSFVYQAFGTLNSVNSDLSIFFGGLFSYKLIDNERLKLLPKFGIGLEDVNTGLTSEDASRVGFSDDKEYHNIRTLHLSFGLSAMTPIFKKRYLGFEINYHYCPYGLDQNLKTHIDNNLISAELFWRL